MKNGLYITDEKLFSDNAKTNGVIKKILTQIEELNIEGQLSCKPLILPRIEKNAVYNGISYILLDIYKKVPVDSCYYDFIYIRRIIPVNYSLVKLLRKIKGNNKKCKIIYEIPTYPYVKEQKDIRSKIIFFIDLLFLSKLKNYINRIATFSNHDEILGIPTIKIMNGIRCVDVPIRTPETSNQNINLIAVAQFAFWHGYDRLIEGLNAFYKNTINKKIYIHLVGDGPELISYRQLVKQYNLSRYVIFHGSLFGEKLTEVFNNADIAVCSLGVHRVGIFLGSFLKSREYLARGIPMVSSTKIDILPDDFKYCLYVPEDESPVDMYHVIEFYQNLQKYQTSQGIIHEIRRFAENNCDMSKTMQPVINYFRE